MADQPDHRLYRQDYREMGSGTPAPSASDPLAELARLIGNDSFSDRHAARAEPSPSEWRDAPAADEIYSTPQAVPGYPADHQTYAPQAAPSVYRQPGYDAPSHDPRGYVQQPYAQQSYEQPVHEPHAAPPSQTRGYTPHATEQGYAQPHQQQPAYDDPYAAAPAFPPVPQPPLRQPPPFLSEQSFPPAGYASAEAEQEDYYEEPSLKRRRVILMAGAAIALVVVGTAGAFGYRVLFGSGASGPPPVIKADASPTKIVAAAPRDSGANKAIQDRIGDQINEKLVSREEQPADVRPQPRVILPGPTAAAGNANGTAGEPKRIRTVAIRPDGPETGPAPRSPAAPAAQAPVRAPVPAQAAAPVQAPAQVAPQAAAPTRQASASAGGGPLSLSPDATPAPAVRQAPQIPQSPRAAAQSASAVAPGAYVQVSSQRSEGDAQASFRALQGKYPAVLGNQVATIHRADLGEKGTYYRAMIGPLGGSDAVELCSSLKAAGGSCVIQKN